MKLSNENQEQLLQSSITFEVLPFWSEASRAAKGRTQAINACFGKAVNGYSHHLENLF